MAGRVHVVGDPILDVYHEGRQEKGRFVIQRTYYRSGAAKNTYVNAKALYPNASRAGILSPYDTSKDYRVVRHCVNQKSIFTTVEESMSFLPYAGTDGLITLDAYEGGKDDTIIVSDYGKGTVSHIQPGHLRCTKESKLVVVDSRYRTYDFQAVRARTSIWRCTEGEYEAKWAKNFDYIVFTDHGKKIYIEDMKTGAYTLAELPAVENILDTCGAGDTFTAALGVKLHQLSEDGEINIERIKTASAFAHRAAVSAIQQPYTAITQIRLEE